MPRRSNQNVFSTPSEALATIPQGTGFKVREFTGGRPREVVREDGTEIWDHATFERALADGALPRSNYTFRPIKNGRMTNQTVTLDLSVSSTSASVDALPQAEAALQPGQESAAIVRMLRESYQDERDEVWELRERLDEAMKENLDLRLKIKDLEHGLHESQREDTLTQYLQKAGTELLKGPGGGVLANRLGEWLAKGGGGEILKGAAEAAKAK